MNCLQKIKAIQQVVGIEEDGIASSKTWLNVYYMLFEKLPYDLNIVSMIRTIQEKINVQADGYPWDKTLDVLYDVLVGNVADYMVNQNEEEAPQHEGELTEKANGESAQVQSSTSDSCKLDRLSWSFESFEGIDLDGKFNFCG